MTNGTKFAGAFITENAISNAAPAQPSPDPRWPRVAAKPRKNGTNPMRARANSQALASAANRWCVMACTDRARSPELELSWPVNTAAKMIRAVAASPKMAATRGRAGFNARSPLAFMGSSLPSYYLPIIDYRLQATDLLAPQSTIGNPQSEVGEHGRGIQDRAGRLVHQGVSSRRSAIGSSASERPGARSR